MNRTILRVLAPLVVAGLAFHAAHAAAQAEALTPEQKQAIDRLVTEEVSRQRIPGLSLAVGAKGKLLGSRGYGYADLENNVPVTPATVFRLASISKPITAVAAMQLVEEGKLDLDAPVQRYVPSFPEKQWTVTTRQLLGHLGGIRHYLPGEVASTRRYETLSEALSIFQRDPLVHQPGTRYLYSSYGFNLAGCVVEGASGTRFMPYLRSRILDPAGMRTLRDDDQAALIPHRAQGYRKLPNGELRNSILADVSNKIPGGGLCGTAEDLVHFGLALQENRLMKPETQAQMFTPGKLPDGKLTGYALGWSVAERSGVREANHGGGQPRVATFLHTRPDQRIVVAVMTNLEGASLPDLARRIAAVVEGGS